MPMAPTPAGALALIKLQPAPSPRLVRALVSRALIGLGRSAARTFMVLLGGFALAWSAYVLPVFWQQAPFERIATRVIAGDPFKPRALAELLPGVQALERGRVCRPSGLRAAAVIRLRLAEDSIKGGEPEIDGSLNSLRDSIHLSLECSPADPFLWLVLFWVENALNGFSPDHLAYLRMSYREGPDEGWIALKRNGFALALLDQLPPDLAETALAEFQRLLSSGFYEAALAIFTGPGWLNRNLLLSRIKNVPDLNREVFARMLHGEGYQVDVPGTKRFGERPWH